MSVVVSVTARRIRASTHATARPTTTPPTAAVRKLTPTSARLTAPAIARMAVRTTTRAVASLKSDSPSRMVTMRRGSPIRRATAVAATASGGATIPPRARATANGTSRSFQTTRATPKAVKSTSPTESSPMTRLLAPRSTSDVRIDAAYSRGGRIPRRITWGPTSTSGTAGTKERTAPTATRSNGADAPRRRAVAATRTTTAAMARSVRAAVTGQSWHEAQKPVSALRVAPAPVPSRGPRRGRE